MEPPDLESTSLTDNIAPGQHRSRTTSPEQHCSRAALLQTSIAPEQARASASASVAELIDLTKEEEAKDEVDLTMNDE